MAFHSDWKAYSFLPCALATDALHPCSGVISPCVPLGLLQIFSKLAKHMEFVSDSGVWPTSCPPKDSVFAEMVTGSRSGAVNVFAIAEFSIC